MKISLIVPIYNESKTIGSMLHQLENLPGDWEILFADGGSCDDTLAQIGNRFRMLNAPKGRANQMNYAAGQASSDVVWFVHCDSQLPKDAHAQISAAVEKGAKWGCFRIGFNYTVFSFRNCYCVVRSEILDFNIADCKGCVGRSPPH